jgi:CheY-like chemotaxis protein
MNHEGVLIVDDNSADRFIIGKAISSFRPGTLIEETSDGAEALEFLERGNLPELIFLDYNLPASNGDAVLRGMRSYPEMRYVPVVVLTSSEGRSDIKNAYDAGANSFINKNCGCGSFLEKIGDIIHYWLYLNKTPCRVSQRFPGVLLSRNRTSHVTKSADCGR